MHHLESRRIQKEMELRSLGFGDFKAMRISKWSIALLVLIISYLLLVVAFIAIAAASAQQLISSFHAGNPIDLRSVTDAIYQQIATGRNFIASHIPFFRRWQFPLPPFFIPPHVYLPNLTASLIAQASSLRHFLIEYAGDAAAYLCTKDISSRSCAAKSQGWARRPRPIYWGSNPPARGANAQQPRDTFLTTRTSSSSRTPLEPGGLRHDECDLQYRKHQPATRRTEAGCASNPGPYHLRIAARQDGLHLSRAIQTQYTRRKNSRNACVRDSAADLRLQIPLPARPVRFGPLWINLWSVMDIVSGKLLYYDDESKAPTQQSTVQNVADWRAWIPLYAHVQYWKGTLLRKTVYDQLV